MEKISKKDIEDALSKAMHPEINFSLIKLGMIKNIEIKNNDISVMLMVPFLEIPIKEDLINIIKEAIMNLNKDLKIKIKIAKMNEKEKDEFMKMAREGWKF